MSDMGIGSFSANSAGMIAAADRLAQISKAMDQEVNSLEQEVESRLIGNWEGAAREAYWQHKKVWDQAFTRMGQLTQMSSLTVANSQNSLFSAEGANVRSWGNA